LMSSVSNLLYDLWTLMSQIVHYLHQPVDVCKLLVERDAFRNAGLTWDIPELGHKTSIADRKTFETCQSR